MTELFSTDRTGMAFSARSILESPCWGQENVRRCIYDRRILCHSQLHRGGLLAEKSIGNSHCRVRANARPSCGCAERCLLIQKDMKSTCYHSVQVAPSEYLHLLLFQQSNGSFLPPSGGMRRTLLSHRRAPFSVSFL